MKKSRFSEQQIAFILKQADDGKSVEEVCRKAGISQQTYYRWRKKYAGLMPSELRRLKQLEEENGRLKRMVADLSLDKECCRTLSAESSEACEGTGVGRLHAGCLAGEHPPRLWCPSAGSLDLPLQIPPPVAGRLEETHPGDCRDPCSLRLPA